MRLVNARAASLAVMVAFLASCAGSPRTEVSDATSSTAWATDFEVGSFPEFPVGAVRDAAAASTQAALEEAVESGVIRGATAAVVVAGNGTWTGTAGVDRRGDPLQEGSVLSVPEVGKTVIAAQVLRLAEEGVFDLDDAVLEHLPAELGSFDLNGATIRHLLGMRSGLSDTPWTLMMAPDTPIAERLAAIPPPEYPLGTITYDQINYHLLHEIITHETGLSLPEVLATGVLVGPVRDGLRPEGPHTIQFEADAATLARWGYDLFGGHVLRDASLREMIDFRGEIYGLGVMDLSHPRAEFGHGVPAMGYDGMESFSVVRLAVFPESGVSVAVLATASTLYGILPLVEALRDAARS